MKNEMVKLERHNGWLHGHRIYDLTIWEARRIMKKLGYNASESWVTSAHKFSYIKYTKPGCETRYIMRIAIA